jgi:hypothetical protein
MTAAVWGNLIQLATFGVVAVTAVFGLRQVKLMRHGGGGANVMDFWELVQSDHARDQRRIMWATLDQYGAFERSKWPDEGLPAVRHVAQIWSVGCGDGCVWCAVHGPGSFPVKAPVRW